MDSESVLVAEAGVVFKSSRLKDESAICNVHVIQLWNERTCSSSVANYWTWEQDGNKIKFPNEVFHSDGPFWVPNRTVQWNVLKKNICYLV